jgi:voltage-gated potassium channel
MKPIAGIGLERELIGGRSHRRSARGHLRVALCFLAAVVFGGTAGYMSVEGWGFIDSLYMTVLTLSTVGYGEVYPLSPAGKILSIVIIVTGVGAAAYAVGTAGKLMLEDRIMAALGRRYMKSIQKMKDHYVICGFGRMGMVICQEMAERGASFVVVDYHQEATEELERLGYLYVRGDATEDETLLAAGIDRARGIVSVVTNDSENVFIVLTARGLNPKLYIVSRAASDESVQKLIRAGANKVVSPYDLGGSRIAQAVLSPTVLDFIESLVDDKTMDLHLEEVVVTGDSPLAGVDLAHSNLRRDLNLIILAIKEITGRMVFNPSFEQEITAGATLVVLGHRPDLDKLLKIAKGK